MTAPFKLLVGHERSQRGLLWPMDISRAPIGALRVASAVDFLRLFVAKTALVDRR
jgi:hypothetical protein